jgi:hypothetical protein
VTSCKRQLPVRVVHVQVAAAVTQDNRRWNRFVSGSTLSTDFVPAAVSQEAPAAVAVRVVAARLAGLVAAAAAPLVVVDQAVVALAAGLPAVVDRVVDAPRAEEY